MLPDAMPTAKHEHESPALQCVRDQMNLVLREKVPSAQSIRLLMVDLRIALEDLRLESKYKVISMYGNWCCHSRLAKSKDCHFILEKVQSAYESRKKAECEELSKMGIDPMSHEAGNVPITPIIAEKFGSEIIDCFKLEKLKSELVVFFSKYKIEMAILKAESNWKQFVFLLFRSLAQKPIILPENSPVFEKMKTRAQRVKFMPRKLYIQELKSIESKEVVLRWVVEMHGGSSICGKLISATNCL